MYTVTSPNVNGLILLNIHFYRSLSTWTTTTLSSSVKITTTEHKFFLWGSEGGLWGRALKPGSERFKLVGQSETRPGDQRGSRAGRQSLRSCTSVREGHTLRSNHWSQAALRLSQLINLLLINISFWKKTNKNLTI